MVHLKPLPGSPRCGLLDDVIKQAILDAESLKSGGVDGLQVENMGDKPFLKPSNLGVETVAMVTIVAKEVRQLTGLPTGVFILANSIEQALSAAKSSGSSWVRSNLWANAYIADEGYVEASAPSVTRLSSRIYGKEIKVFADVYVKHGSHFIISDKTLKEYIMDLELFKADAIVVTGHRTGEPAPLELVKNVRSLSKKPVIVGSGITDKNVKVFLKYADGAIVGTYFKKGGILGNPVDEARVKALMKEVFDYRN